MNEILNKVKAAADSGKLLPTSAANIDFLFGANPSRVEVESVRELVETGNWSELDNRFFRTLAFGTGGLRGKSIGMVVTKAEAGEPQPLDRPEFPCTGTNAMNYLNISRATQGLVNYVLKHWKSTGGNGKASICICHDTRHFSREFAELAARVITEHGCDAYLFEGPRSTPELSFAVRRTHSTAGINITASHNPPQYNGYKVYFEDGAQVVEPHASAIIECVNAVSGPDYTPVPPDQRGHVIPMGQEMDAAYMDRLETLPLDPALLKSQGDFKVVYTPLHGVGAVIIKPMLARLGITAEYVSEQEIPDGRFPTVKSPNPENAEALTMAVALADECRADLVIATDPDDDRMGIAARDAEGKMVLLTGNQTGILLCWYRVRRHLELGILPQSDASKGVVIKTFVTTDLQKLIAERHGLSCVETLTGFKYIGQKLQKYEEQIPAHQRTDYRNLSEEQTRALRLQYSKLYVFGGEESYGYSGSDFVRDKDGNSAAVMIAEVAAYARSQGLTLVTLLDRIYQEYGYFFEQGESIVMDGAEGAAKIQALVKSYADHPPTEWDGSRVTSTRNFAIEDIHDSEGDLIPKESMLVVSLADGRKVAVRPSGTEPKIKYYLFVSRPAPEGGFSAEALADEKRTAHDAIVSLWKAIHSDAEARLGGTE